MGSPVLWGPNNYANNLQNAELTATGALLAYNGPKNYITYGNFENQLTTGWSLGTIGTLTNGLPTGSPTFGSGASGNLSIAIVTSNQLAGTASLSYVSSAATTAGNMLASQAYTIDVEDQAKVLGFKFSYSAISNASNANWSGTSSNSFGVAVYDVTNSVFLGVAGAFNIVQSSGTGIATGTFQTGTTTASIRFIVYNVNATSGAITLYLDNFQMGPQVTMQAPAISDWNSYTPTGSWVANTTYSGKYRRIGDSVEIQISLSLTGAPTATSLTFNIPSNLTIDTTKLVLTSGAVPVFGQAAGVHSGTFYNFVVLYNTTSSVSVVYQSALTGSITGVNATSPITWASGDTVTVNCLVPIVGFSSNSVSSNDTDTRVVASKGVLSANQTITTGNTTIITFNNTLDAFDLTGSFNYTTGVYTASVTGKYQIQLYAGLTTTLASVYFHVYLNGVQSSRLSGADVAAVRNFTGSVVVSANAGTTIDVRIVNSSGSSATLFGSTTDYGACALYIERISGPAVITATESVNAAYGNGAGTSITSSSTVVPWPTKVFDSHSAMNVNGTYTVPVSGKYLVSATILTASTAFAVANNLQLYLYKNGSSVNTLGYNYVLGTTRAWVTGNNIVNCNAGDTIQIYMNVGSGSATLSNATTDNFISIARVGN